MSWTAYINLFRSKSATLYTSKSSRPIVCVFTSETRVFNQISKHTLNPFDVTSRITPNHSSKIHVKNNIRQGAKFSLKVSFLWHTNHNQSVPETARKAHAQIKLRSKNKNNKKLRELPRRVNTHSIPWSSRYLNADPTQPKKSLPCREGNNQIGQTGIKSSHSDSVQVGERGFLPGKGIRFGQWTNAVWVGLKTTAAAGITSRCESLCWLPDEDEWYTYCLVCDLCYVLRCK